MPDRAASDEPCTGWWVGGKNICRCIECCPRCRPKLGDWDYA